MKPPRFFSLRSATMLALGCALLAIAPLSSAQVQIKVVPITMDSVNKMGKFVETVNNDPDSKAAMEEMGKDEAVSTAMMSGGSVNDTVNTKYPKAAAVFKNAGLTPDDFFVAVMSIGMASAGVAEGTSDATVAKANVDFFNANKDKIEGIMSKMK